MVQSNNYLAISPVKEVLVHKMHQTIIKFQIISLHEPHCINGILATPGDITFQPLIQMSKTISINLSMILIGPNDKMESLRICSGCPAIWVITIGNPRSLHTRENTCFIILRGKERTFIELQMRDYKVLIEDGRS